MNVINIFSNDQMLHQIIAKQLNSLNIHGMKKFGIILLILGMVFICFTAVTFFTREKVVDLGSVEITANRPHHFSWSPLIGIAVIALGGVFIWQSSRK